MSHQSEHGQPARETLTLAHLIAEDPFRARRPIMPGARTPLGARPGARGLKTGDVDGLSPYAPGGDIRMIDWRGFARSGQLRLKEREREAHSAIMLVADMGPHMRFGTSGGTLARRAALQTARHAWIALRRDEPVGIAAWPNGVLAQPARGRKRLMHALDSLAHAFNTTTGDVPSLSNCLDMASRRMRSADELWLFSDFHHWSRSDAMPEAASGTTGLWHAVQINDPVHLAPPPSGTYPARSMATDTTDEDINLYLDEAGHGHAAAVSASTLNRELEAAGWRVSRGSMVAPKSWSDVA